MFLNGNLQISKIQEVVLSEKGILINIYKAKRKEIKEIGKIYKERAQPSTCVRMGTKFKRLKKNSLCNAQS